MEIIKRIEIRNFRSIHHLILDDVNKDVNVFVGNNDIGKSNILRSLNLFFNNQTDIGTRINFTEDFNKNIERKSGKGQYIKIVIDIDIKYENKKYVKWTKQWNNKGELIINQKDVFLEGGTLSSFSYNSRAEGWLENIKFRYVPAIKSPIYFQHLFEELHDLMSTTYSEQFIKNTEALIKSIQSITKDISDELKDSISIENKISLPIDLKTFFGSLDFSLQMSDKKFNLKGRGDGIKVRHIPVVLKFLAEKVKANKRGALDIQTIWGFEEPENNLEMSHAFEMAKKFIEYSKNIQIFLTTHSPAFYSLKDEKRNVITWFVDRNNEGYTVANNIDNLNEIDIDEKMGMLGYITPFIKEKDAELKKQKKENSDLKSELEKLKSTTKIIVFTEDENNELDSLKVYFSLNGFTEQNTEFYSYYGKNNINGALIAADTLKATNSQIKQIIIHRDMDVDGESFSDKFTKRLTEKGRKDYHLFMPKGYDIESLYINSYHLNCLFPQISIEELDKIIDEATIETKPKSIEKLTNILMPLRIKEKQENGDNIQYINYSKIVKEIDEIYESNITRYRYGKKVLNLIKVKIQEKLGKNIFIENQSEFLLDEQLIEILKKIN